MGLGVLGFADALSRLSPDTLVILGDRYEALAAAQTAMILRIPVVHLHGGEITEGAYDDAIRHAITKLSYFHLTANDSYRDTVIQLGESPDRVLNVGSIGLDHLRRTTFLSLTELSKSIEFELTKPFFLVTYHPVTLANENASNSFQALLKSLDDFPDYQVILTYPNADNGGRLIIPILEAYAADNPERVLAIPSLGQLRYLSSVKHSSAVIGNSSSGIAEVPSFAIPTVNIGSRQKGRLMAESVINCKPCVASITEAIAKAINLQGLTGENPYGRGDASSQIIKVLKDLSPIPEKSFYDLKRENT
jgi:UDP-N-acetylglucosamine 2-epimerase (non-hydrolysing)